MKEFCKQLLIQNFNAKQAAITAGYSEKTAEQQASRLLTKVKVQEYLTELKDKRNKRLEITQDDVLRDIIKVKERCLQEEPVKDRNGNVTGEYKFDSNGALKALDMLSKHTGFYEKDNKQQQGGIIIQLPDNGR